MRYTSIKRAYCSKTFLMCSLVVIALHLQSHLAIAERSSLRVRKQSQRTAPIISNNLNQPILPMKVDDTKNDHYIITSTNTSRGYMQNLRSTNQKRIDEYSFVPSHRKLQKPDYTYDCLADWTSIKSAIILSSVLSPDDPPDFVLCPDTVILLQIDETTQMEPVDIKIDNAKFKCGENGKQEDKCLIVGGYAHFRLIGNVKGVTFQGITFSGSSMASILATGESNANAEFQDCAWIDNKGLTAVLIYNEDKGVPVDKLSNIQDLVEPRAKSMTLTFRDCVFSRNKNKYSTVLNLAGKANFVSTVFVSNQSRGGSIRIKFSSTLNMVKACFFENKAERAGIVVIEEKSGIEVNKDTYGEANSAEVGICSKIFYEVGDSCIDNEDEISCIGMCGFFTADTCDVDLERVASDSNVIKSILDNTYDGSGNGDGGGGNVLGKLSLELLIAGGVGFVIFVFFLVCCIGRCCYRSGMKKGKADYQLLQSHDNNQGPGGPSDSCGTSGTSAPSEQPTTNIPVATPATQDIFEDNGIVASTVAQVDNGSTVAISQDEKEKKSEEGKPKPSITPPPPPASSGLKAPVNRQSTNMKKASEDFLPTFKRSKRRESNASDAFAFGGLMQDDDDSELGVLGKKVKKKSDKDSERSSKGESDGKEKSERKVRIKDQETSSGEESDSDESKDEKNSKKKKSRKSLRKSRRQSTDEEATDDNEEHRKSRRHASDDEDAVKKSKSSLRKSRIYASDDEDAVKKSKDELRKSRRRTSDDEEATDDNEEHRKSRRHASDDEDAVKKSKSSLRKSRKHASDDEDAIKKSKDEVRKSRRHASDDEDAIKKSKDELRKSRRHASDDEDATKKGNEEHRKSRRHASDDEDAVKKSKDKLRKSRRRASDDEEATDDNEEHRKSRRHASDDEDAVKIGKESLRKSRRRAKDGEDDDRKKSKEKHSRKKDFVDNDHIDKRKKLEKRSSVTRLSSDDDQKQNVKTPKTGETSKRKLDRSESSSKLNRSESSRKLDRSDSTSKLKRTVSDRKLDRSESSSNLEKSDGEAKKSHKPDRHKLERQLSRSSSKMDADTSESGSPKLPKRTSRRYSRRLSASDIFTDDDESDAVSLASGSSAWQTSIEGSIHRSTSLTDMEGEAKAAFRRTSLASNRSQSFSIPNRKNLLDKESVERRRASMDFSIASSMDESMGRRDSLEHTPKNRRDSIKSIQYDSKKKLNEEEKAQIQKRTRTRSVTPIKSRSKDGKSSPSSDEKKESSSRSKRASTERKREKSSTSEPRSKRSSTGKSRDCSEAPVSPKKSSRSKRSDGSKEKSRKPSTGRDSKSRDRSRSPPTKSKKESKTRTRERDSSKSKKSENGGDSRKRSGLSSSMPEKKSSDSKPSANLRASMPVSSSNRREAMKESRRASTTSIEEESKKTSSKITKEKLLEDLNKMTKKKPDRFTNRKKIEQKGPRNMSKLAAFSLRDLKKSTKK